MCGCAYTHTHTHTNTDVRTVYDQWPIHRHATHRHTNCTTPRVRRHPEFAKQVTNIAKHLPGGLGWGTATMAPVNEDVYNMHAVNQFTASVYYQHGHLRVRHGHIQYFYVSPTVFLCEG